MSIEICNAILWKLGNQNPSFTRKRFQDGGERVVNNFHRGRCKLRKNIANVWHPLCKLQCFSVVIVARQVARKIASCNMALTFRNVARQVAAFDMSTATCHAILWKLGNQSPSFARRRFQAGGERAVNNFQRRLCKLRRNIANVWHPLCNLQHFSVVIVAR